MVSDLQTKPEPGVSAIVAGILQDLERLLGQQWDLLRREVRQDLSRTREAVSLLAGGLFVSLLATIMLCLALAYLLHWALPDLPLWGAFGLVGAGLAAAGGYLVWAGKKKFDSFNPLPDESAQALKENVQWLTTTPK